MILHWEGVIFMEDKKNASPDVCRNVNALGMFINGIFLGSGSRTFRSTAGVERVIYECSVALPGLSGAVLLGIGPSGCEYITSHYTLGQEIHFQIEPPRASGSRVYFSAVACDGVDCSV